jgi:co-chaperonin GroES (HSP10)
MKVRTMNGFVLVREDGQTANQNAIFKDHSMVPNKGVVIKAEDKTLEGSIVYFSNRSERIKLGGEELLAMKVENIIAIVED